MDVSSALSARIRTGVIINIKHKDPSAFLEDCIPLINSRIHNARNNGGMHSLKMNLELCCNFILPTSEEREQKYFTTKSMVVLQSTDIGQLVREYNSNICTQMEEFSERKSGWAFESINYLLVIMNKYSPLAAGIHIPLPTALSKRKRGAIVNIRNTDNKCFIYCLFAGLFDMCSSEMESYTHFNFDDYFNLEGISFPTQLSNVSKFEK